MGKAAQLEDVIGDLSTACEELYLEGYHAGRLDELWYQAWAEAMYRVAHGDTYTEYMVVDIYRELKNDTRKR